MTGEHGAGEWVGADNWLVQALATAHAERDAARALAEERAGVIREIAAFANDDRIDDDMARERIVRLAAGRVPDEGGA